MLLHHINDSFSYMRSHINAFINKWIHMRTHARPKMDKTRICIVSMYIQTYTHTYITYTQNTRTQIYTQA